ncbi:hypothetical protein GCM10027275_41570 [Rhabdobacter roseus]|uniref:Lipoprotein n=1 Tax=Rhabdobacter roseus TaxID=1655419 RepID=A0A840TS50_9BACT|nr:hypothetical protein [Rhabdobacter roseus]MBB5286134.1 hypothetical protein [Rhabdobacter roseus]
MKRIRRKLHHFFLRPVYALVVIVGAMLACEKKEPAPDCGCEGTFSQPVDSVVVQYYGNQVFIPRDLTKNPFRFFMACQQDSTWVVSSPQDPYYYVISGLEGKPCPSAFDMHNMQSVIPIISYIPLNITSIEALK